MLSVSECPQTQIVYPLIPISIFAMTHYPNLFPRLLYVRSSKMVHTIPIRPSLAVFD